MAFCGGGTLITDHKADAAKDAGAQEDSAKGTGEWPFSPLPEPCWLRGPPQALAAWWGSLPPPGPQISGKSDVGWWDSGPATLNVLLESGSVTPGTSPLSVSQCVFWEVSEVTCAARIQPCLLSSPINWQQLYGWLRIEGLWSYIFTEEERANSDGWRGSLGTIFPLKPKILWPSTTHWVRCFAKSKSSLWPSRYISF